MPKNISTIIIHADRKTVWDAITIPASVKQWQYGSDLTTTWKPGSPIKFRTAWEDKIFEQWGEVIAVEPYEKLEYSLFAPRPGLEDRPENYFIMQYRLTDDNGTTKLEIIQDDNRPGAVQEEPQGEENPILKALKDFAEGAGE